MNKAIQVILLSILLTSTSCYEQQEGCLDPLAINFNAEADKDCCCTYPELTLVWDYFNGGQEFAPGDTIRPVAGNPFVLLDFDIVGAQVGLDTNGGFLRVREKEQVTFNALSGIPRTLITDDIFYLSPTRFNHKLGSFVYSGNIRGIQFQWSPVDSFQYANVESFEDSHPLRLVGQQGLVNDTTGEFSFVNISYILEQDTQSIQLGQSSPLTIFQEMDTLLNQLTPLQIRLRLDLEALFSGIDLKNSNAEDIWSTFGQNANEAVILVD